MQAIEISQHGGPDVLQVVDRDLQAAAGQLLVEVAAAGVNYIDTYQRRGIYPVQLPFYPGSEGAGRVVAVGDGVSDFAAGDRVAWAAGSGGYAEQAVVSAESAVRIPDGVDETTAAAVMLQGLTAHYLAASTFPISPGDTALVHAGAGGVGLLLTQIIKIRGGTAYTTVSTEEKAELSRGAGADEVILYTQTDFTDEVQRLTGGRGVDVVYDGVGETTFDGSLESLRPRGMLVLFGASSGAVPPVDPQRLNRGGSLFLTRPTLAHYTLTRAELEERTNELLGWVADGKLDVRIGGTYPLAKAARAHSDLQGRLTTGKLLIIPR
ncbi:MAG TPA: quinone oxidoreductase [Mycobacteriales bacterium]|nr:quinone oxidoreductase [Mycobacteriales bacterium]